MQDIRVPAAGRAAGPLLVAAAATAFAANSTVARLSYDGGMNALTLNTLRFVVCAAILFLLLRWQRAPLRLPARQRWIAAGCGVLTGLYSYALFRAIEYIPVALAVLIFYTFPLLTALVAWASGRERPTRRGAAAIGLAFLGLVLALDPAGRPHPVGIALGLFAAVGVTVVIAVVSRVVGSSDSRPVVLHVQVTGATGFLLACLITGGAVLPSAPVGWLGVLLVPLLYTFAFTGFYVGVSRIGPVAAATVMNLEPVMSVLFGWLLLGQVLGPQQLAGVALVVGALVLLRLPRRPGGG